MEGFENFMKEIKAKNFEEVQRLYCADYLQMRDETGCTPLHEACYYGNIDIVKYLLNKGSDIESTENAYNYKPIHIAVINEHPMIVEELLNRQCDLKSKDLDGNTALFYASKNKTCEQLLKEAMKTQSIELVPSLTDYIREDMIDRGGFGKVFKCLDPKISLYFAMKEVPITVNGSSHGTVNSLENEIKIYTELLPHPNIVRYYGSRIDSHSIYISMEYMSKGSLRKKLDISNTFVLADIAWYTKQILEGLRFLHNNAIIHRDIKAANILLGDTNNVKLCDFGISRKLETISSSSMSNDVKERAMANTSCGSPYWMAPEVINAELYNFPADVWSLGATVMEMVTGKPPYFDRGRMPAMIKIANLVAMEYPCQIQEDLLSFLNSTFIVDPKKRSKIHSLLESPFIIKFLPGNTTLGE